MKKYISILMKSVFGMMLILSVSCENSDEFLERVNPNSVTPESFWVSETAAEQWLTAGYSSLVYGKGYTNSNFGRFFAWASVYRSDEYATSFGNAWGQANAEFTLDASNPVVDALWVSFYTTIFRANHALEQIPEMTGIDEQKRNELIGEAEFLRGISYFYLVNLWHKVPLITSVPVTDEDYLPFQAEREEVWTQVITDLTNAKARLTTITSRDDENLGRVTWGAAVGHLGKAYLYHGDWQEAADEFEELIDSNIYDLMVNYRDNGNDLFENNIESIFEAQCDWEINNRYSTWRSRDGGPAKYAASHGKVEPWLVDTFLEETTIDGDVDPRALATLIFPHPESTLYGGLTYEEAYDTADPSAPAYWKKYRNVETKANDSNGLASSINIRIMRFADVLLMFAEAENEANGPTVNAQEAFNRVRDRANMSSVDSEINQLDFRAVIRRERVLELSGEENRWMDLKRWGILEERFNDSNVISGEFFDINKHEYYPIPASEVQSNPNIDQYADY